ncbi:GerMN domain-containing protein [Patescibacteria group bacterium]|nr:GerMN domain-containing protein [Patescibacteria group bacterium]
MMRTPKAVLSVFLLIALFITVSCTSTKTRTEPVLSSSQLQEKEVFEQAIKYVKESSFFSRNGIDIVAEYADEQVVYQDAREAYLVELPVVISTEYATVQNKEVQVIISDNKIVEANIINTWDLVEDKQILPAISSFGQMTSIEQGKQLSMFVLENAAFFVSVQGEEIEATKSSVDTSCLACYDYSFNFSDQTGNNYVFESRMQGGEIVKANIVNQEDLLSTDSLRKKAQISSIPEYVPEDVTLYFINRKDWEGAGECPEAQGFDVVAEVSTASASPLHWDALQKLLAGVGAPQGYESVFMPGTQINSIDIKGDTFYVDFNSALNVGSLCEFKMRESQISQTIKNIPGYGIEKVAISVEGDFNNVKLP